MDAPPSSTSNLTIDQAAQLTAWGAETLATAVGVATDPLRLRQLGREAFGDRATVSEELLASAIASVAASAKLQVHPVILEAANFHEATLPLLTSGGPGLVVTERRGDQVLVHRLEHEPAWLSIEALFDLLGPGVHPWLTAVPAAPLEDLGGHAQGHHPSPVRRLIALMHLERDDLQVIFIYAVVVGLLTLAAPIAVQALVTTVAFGTLLQPIVVLSLMLLTALGFQAILKALQARVVESLLQRLFVRAATDLAWRLPRVTRHSGFGPETVNRFFEVMTLQKTASVLLTDGLATVLQVAIGLIVLAFYHPALLAFDLALLGLATVVVIVPLRRGLKTSIDESYAKYDVAAWLEELARPGNALRGASGVTFAVERADALTGRYLEARRRHFGVVFGQTIGALALQVFASTGLLGLGGFLVVQQSLTLGQLVAAELIVAAVASSLSKMGKLLDSTYDLLTALDKMGHLVDLPIEDSAGGEPVPGQGAVRVEVKAAREEDQAALSLEVPAGGRLAIIGAEGHSLAQWLGALRVPPQGVVALNGVETSRVRALALRDRLAHVQARDFFEGTVLENLTLGRVGVTAADARAALQRVGLLDELRLLPQGLDARLMHDGAPLTPSQLTRLLVARALAGSPRLIVFEASLESLLPEHRAQCVAALTREGAPWTLVAFAQDPQVALAKACGRVISLDAPSEVAR